MRQSYLIPLWRANFNIFSYIFQEKKGQEQQKPEEKEAQRREFEINKMEKLLAMVRNVDKDSK